MNFIFDLDGTLIKEDAKKSYEIFFEHLSSRFYEKFGIDKTMFISSMYNTIKAMDSIDGKENIEKQFFKVLHSLINVDISDISAQFEEFYNNEFDKVLEAYGGIPQTNEILNFLSKQNHNIIIATDPLLPEIAVTKKIKHANLNPNTFDFVTYNTNSNYTKSNNQFFIDLFKNLNLNPEETIVIGNTIPTDIPSFPVKEVLIISESLYEKSVTDRQYTLVTYDELLNYILNYSQTIQQKD